MIYEIDSMVIKININTKQEKNFLIVLFSMSLKRNNNLC